MANGLDLFNIANTPAASITTWIFIFGIGLFALLIIVRYQTLERSIQDYMLTTDAILTYMEYGREPDPDNKKVFDSFNDYRAILRDSQGSADYFIKFKRKNLEMQRQIIPQVEFCRTSIETLPFLGILGTVLGFLLTPDLFTESFAGTTSGLVLALSSTAAALFCTIFIKLFYESKILPQYVQFENALQAIESYGDRHGGLEASQ